MILSNLAIQPLESSPIDPQLFWFLLNIFSSNSAEKVKLLRFFLAKFILFESIFFLSKAKIASNSIWWNDKS